MPQPRWCVLFLGPLVTIASGTAGAQQPSPPRAPAVAADDHEFLEDVQKRTFDYFWYTTPEHTGLVRDRWPRNSPCSIAAVGFGLTSYAVGVERGWITRETAAHRVRTTLDYLWNAPQGEAPDAAGHRGFFYHFLELDSGRRWRDCELSSVDTAWLMAGVLFCEQYFNQQNRDEQAIREQARKLYERVEWDWIQPRPPLIGMGWRPETGFDPSDYRGYDEAMLLYVLALGSPTHAISPDAWPAFTSTYIWGNYHGQEHVNFSPLFGHQFSHVWIDFRGIRDEYMREKDIDYFENSRRATYSQQAYAIAHAKKWAGYGEHLWGLTACDGPFDGEFEHQGERRSCFSYSARGASLEYIRDDGTIAPTAVGGAMPFAPEIAEPTLRSIVDRYGATAYGMYGFFDSFNPSLKETSAPLTHGQIDARNGWHDTDYLGIDQGPILLMIENYRSELVWKYMRSSPTIVRGLNQAGFDGGWMTTTR